MAQGVPRPDGLPPGPVRALVNALHDLYRDAGMPSMRTISRAIRDRGDLRDTVSHETVAQMLRGESVPGWMKVECVIRYLADVAVRQPDIQAEVARFHELWLAIVARETRSMPAQAAAPIEPAEQDDAETSPLVDIAGEIPPRNLRFVGRDHILRTVHEILRSGASLVALSGGGGMGKSQLAVEYLHRHRDQYDLIWWVPAEHPSRLRECLAKLGSKLNLPSSHAMQHPPAQVLDALRRSDLRWLLVFDNVAAPDSLPPLTALGNGRVLLTTRDPDWASHGTQLDITVFDRRESVRMLRDRASDITVEEANLLAERLGDFPLAVEQVAAWHRATGVPVASYLDDLDRQVRKILSGGRDKATRYPATVPGFLNVAFAQLAEAAPAAAQLLELFAWLGAEPMSLTLLHSGRQGNVTSPLREALRQRSLLDSAARELRRHGLVLVLDGDPVRIQVHRVFRWALQDWLGEKRLARGRANVLAILAAANPGSPDDSQFWAYYAEVGPHITPAAFATADEFEVRRVALDQVRYLFRIGHYEQSKALAHELITASPDNGTSETDHHFFVLVRHHLGNALRMLGDYAEARRVTLEALTYVDAHPDFAPPEEYLTDLDTNRAALMRIAGLYNEALTVDEAILDNQQRKGIDDSSKIRIIRNNIAVNFRLLGRFFDAYQIDQEIVRQWTDARGAQDPRTLFARSNLARDLFGLGRYTDTLNEVQALLPSYRNVIGTNHHGVLLAVRTEVMALRKVGDLAAALRLAVQNLNDLLTWFGPRHEYPLAAGISLVNARLAMRDLGSAMVETPKLLARCEAIFQPVHPMTLAVQVCSASVLRAFGDANGAYRRDERATSELRRVLGAEHPYTLCANHNLAIDLALLGRSDQAVAEAAVTLDRSRAARGENHPDTLAAAINLGLAQGKPDDHAMRAWEDTHGATHPLVLAARQGRWIECDIEPPPT